MDIVQKLTEAGFPGAQLVGSRITCNPAPVGTDQDVLLLVPTTKFDEVYVWATGIGFKLDGSEIEDYLQIAPTDTFQSLSDGEYNIIVTEDEGFFRKFMAATGVAKKLNLLDKADRVLLFQAVLYANGPEPIEVPRVADDLDFL